MKNDFIKVGGLYKTNVSIFAYDDDPYTNTKRVTFRRVALEDVFIVLDCFLHSKGTGNVFLLKVLLKDEIKFLFVVENNLIEVKEN